jgi:putative dimethyl sulfoxide reductase chaperone
VARGMAKLTFSVAIDAYMCNTALLCDVVLPDATWMEQSQVKADWLYEAFLSYFARIVPPMYDTRPIWRITRDLAEKLDLGVHFAWTDEDQIAARQLAGTPWSLAELQDAGFIITDEAAYEKYRQWGSINPPQGYSSSGKSKTGKYNFVNPVSEEKGIDALPDYKPIAPELAPDSEWPFVFVNFRVLQHEHCSTFNNYNLMRQAGSNPVWINTQDAQSLGIVTDTQVSLESPWGRVQGVARVTDDIARGVLAAAGGYGHQRGLEADPKYPDIGGVNYPGALMPPNTVESTGGTPPLKYIKARVRRA